MIDLRCHVGTRRKVRIERNTPSEPFLNGYVLAMDNGLILMHPFDDFEPDGYTVIRERDVVSVRSNEYERLWDRMLDGEGLLAGLDEAPGVDLSNMQAVIVSVAAQYRFVIIECEDEDEDEHIQVFYLGELVEVAGDVVHFRCLDALAKWDTEIAAIPVAEITKVQFDTPYVRRFTKYIVG
jgi:hypothetical protein